MNTKIKKIIPIFIIIFTISLLTNCGGSSDHQGSIVDPPPLPCTENCVLLLDLDQDGIANNDDNCAEVSNPDQNDSDRDRIGNVCDNDNEGLTPEEISEINEDCTPKAPEADDQDSDGIAEHCDDDVDNDDIKNDEDNCRFHANPDQSDINSNDVGDVCDSTTPQYLEAERLLSFHGRLYGLRYAPYLYDTNNRWINLSHLNHRIMFVDMAVINNTLFFLTQNAGLYQYNEETQILSKVGDNGLDGKNLSTFTLYHGQLTVAADFSGIYRLNAATNQWRLLGNHQFGQDKAFSKMIEFQNVLYVGTKMYGEVALGKGLFKYDDGRWQTITAFRIDNENAEWIPIPERDTQNIDDVLITDNNLLITAHNPFDGNSAHLLKLDAPNERLLKQNSPQLFANNFDAPAFEHKPVVFENMLEHNDGLYIATFHHGLWKIDQAGHWEAIDGHSLFTKLQTMTVHNGRIYAILNNPVWDEDPAQHSSLFIMVDDEWRPINNED